MMNYFFTECNRNSKSIANMLNLKFSSLNTPKGCSGEKFIIYNS